MRLARILLILGSGTSLPITACIVSFESGPRDTTPEAGSDAMVLAESAPLPDVNLPPPPATCKRDGLVCVPEAPAGWSGPFGLFAGASAPGCPSDTTPVLEAKQDLVPAPPATCPACACAPASGYTCGQVLVRGNSATCNCDFGNTTTIAANNCSTTSPGSLICGGFAAGGLSFEPAPTVGGKCDPVAAKPVPTKPPPEWNIAALGCQLSVPSRVDCPEGNVCASQPAPPFNPKLCVMKAGELAACPGFPYSKRSVFHRSAADTRDCADCACGAAPAGTCATKVKTTANNDCSGDTFVDAPACRSINGKPYVLANATPPTNLTCAPSGGASIGGVTVADAVTVCCSE